MEGGGKEWAGPVFPHPTIEKEHAVLDKCFLNVNFSLEQDNHECSDTVQE